MQSSSKIGQTSNIDKLNKPVLLTPGHCQFFGVPHNTDIAFAIAFLHTIEAFFSFLLACLHEQIMPLTAVCGFWSQQLMFSRY
jgi:hypothetical protein